VKVLRGLVHVRPAASTIAATISATPRRLSDGEGIRVLPGTGEMVAISATGDRATSAPRQATRSFKTRLIDLSKSGIAIQSSGFSDTAYPPAHAIDGNPDTFSHTALDDRAPWWQVDLGSSREIVAAVILNRKGAGNSRLRNIRARPILSSILHEARARLLSAVICGSSGNRLRKTAWMMTMACRS
jgi:hypothetical protein